MIVFVETPAGKKFHVDRLGKHDLVNTLKHRIQLEEGTAPASQRLFAHSDDGQQLLYGRTLGDYGLQDGSVIVMRRWEKWEGTGTTGRGNVLSSTAFGKSKGPGAIHGVRT
jgi:hypothetical protein